MVYQYILRIIKNSGLVYYFGSTVILLLLKFDGKALSAWRIDFFFKPIGSISSSNIASVENQNHQRSSYLAIVDDKLLVSISLIRDQLHTALSPNVKLHKAKV